MAAAAVARSVLRSATTFSRSATARLSNGLNPSPFRFQSQKPLSTSIFRSPVGMNSISIASVFSSVAGKNVILRNAACFSSLSKRTHRFRFQRRIDLKRSTPSMGVLEKIEYDPNRTSRIALVRWKGGANHRKCDPTEESFALPEKRLQSTTTTTVRSHFAFSSLPGKADQIKKTSAKDVFFSAFSPKAKKENAFSSSSGFPRIAVAGAKPAFFVFGPKENVGGENTFPLGEIRKWNGDGILWQHRMKRKAALSWQSFRLQEMLGLARASEHKESRPKRDPGFYTKAKNGKGKVGRAPVTYIIASHQSEPGMMVMNH